MVTDMVMTDHISASEYMELRRIVGWAEFPLEQAEEGLKNCYLWCLRESEDSRPIGLARVLWDHGYVIYIADVIVIPEYQGQGLGRVLMEKILEFINEQLRPGFRFMVSLCSAKGKETFYEKFGFKIRPDEDHGPGMCQWFLGE